MSDHHERVTAGTSSGENHAEGGGETPAARAGEGGAAENTHAEFRPLGIDVEAWPFVALAAVASLAPLQGAGLNRLSR